MSTILSACGSKGALYQEEQTDVVKKPTENMPKKVTEKLKKQP
jgi:hypothetical protein